MNLFETLKDIGRLVIFGAARSRKINELFCGHPLRMQHPEGPLERVTPAGIKEYGWSEYRLPCYCMSCGKRWALTWGQLDPTDSEDPKQ